MVPEPSRSCPIAGQGASPSPYGGALSIHLPVHQDLVTLAPTPPHPPASPSPAPPLVSCFSCHPLAPSSRSEGQGRAPPPHSELNPGPCWALPGHLSICPREYLGPLKVPTSDPAPCPDVLSQTPATDHRPPPSASFSCPLVCFVPRHLLPNNLSCLIVLWAPRAVNQTQPGPEHWLARSTVAPGVPQAPAPRWLLSFPVWWVTCTAWAAPSMPPVLVTIDLVFEGL